MGRSLASDNDVERAVQRRRRRLEVHQSTSAGVRCFKSEAESRDLELWFRGAEKVLFFYFPRPENKISVSCNSGTNPNLKFHVIHGW